MGSSQGPAEDDARWNWRRQSFDLIIIPFRAWSRRACDMKFGWGCFSATVHVEGSVATHKENTRSSDNSAKYHVQVLAEDTGMPEGLARVLDILHTAIQPSVKPGSSEPAANGSPT